MAATPRLVVESKGALLENALWVPESGLLWFLDLLGPALHHYNPATGVHERALGGTVPLGRLVRGPGHASFLLARREGIFRLDPATEATSLWNDPNARALDVAYNDGPARGSSVELETMPEAGGLYRPDTGIQGEVEPVVPG